MAVSSDKRIILFGGLTGAAGSPTTDDLWIYNDSGWKRVQSQKGKGPGRRMYSASAILDEKLYMFGGWDPAEPGSGGVFLDDIWCLKLEEPMAWEKLDEKLPYAISRHCACTVDNAIILQTHKSILVFSKEKKISEQPTSGEGPDGFSMCAVAATGKNSMLIFGGSTRTQELSSDAYVLDTTTWSWKRLNCVSDECPRPMASPCGASLNNNSCIVFGGATLGEGGYTAGLIPLKDTWIINVDHDTVKFEKIATSDSSMGPDGRVAASLSPFGSKYILQGGYESSSKATFEETWVLSK